MRTTFKVDDLRNIANRMLADMPCSLEGANIRIGISHLLEVVLQVTENYYGYEYLKQDDVPKDAIPGVLITGTGFSIADNTRRKYLKRGKQQ